MYFYKYSKYKPSNSSISESYIKSVGIFGNNISKYPHIKRKKTPISLDKVISDRSYKVKTYFNLVGSPCNDCSADMPKTTILSAYLHTFIMILYGV